MFSISRLATYGFLISILMLIGVSCKNKPTKTVSTPQPLIGRDSIVLKPDYSIYAEAIDKKFSRLHKRTVFYGNVLFADKGNIVFQKAYGFKKRKKDPEVTLENTFQLASVSKIFTATAIMMLYEQGKINLNDSIQKFIPGLPYEGITIHHLLTHRSGLSKYTHFCDNPSTIWEEKDCSIHNDDVIQIMKEIEPPLAKSVGKRFYYTNTNYMLLASVIEAISDTTYKAFMEENIFKPLGMTSTKVYYRDNEGELINPVIGYESNFRQTDDIYLNGCVGDKGIYSNVHDLLKFDQALYDEKILKKSTQELMYLGYSKPNRWKNESNYGYGYRMIELENNEKVVYHTGWWKGFRTYFIRRIKKEQTIIILTNVKRGSFLNVKDLVELLPD